MSKLEKLIIYPYDIEVAPILRYPGYLKDFDLKAVVSPFDYDSSDDEVEFIDGGKRGSIQVIADFEQALTLCDCVLFADMQLKLDFNKDVYPKIKQAIEKGKNIICTIPLEGNVIEDIASQCKAKALAFNYFNNTFDRFDFQEYKAAKVTDDQETSGFEEEISDIEVPVVFVMGVTEETNKFDIQLAIGERIRSQGYKVAQVGSRNYCDLLGFHSFPQFMYSTELTESLKVVLFNDFIKKVELTEKPDIIIVGVPGGIMPYDNKYTNKFGILAYEICNALEPDFTILSILCENYEEGMLQDMKKTVYYKLGCEVDCFNLANKKINWRESEHSNSFVFTTLAADYVDGKKTGFTDLEVPVYNNLNSGDMDQLTGFLEDKLANYAESLNS